MPTTFTLRDREAARATHRLFWRATRVDLTNFVIWLCTRPPAMLVYNVLIPFEVAYCLQAIITHNVPATHDYAWTVFLLGVAYCILWGVGGVAICRSGRAATIFVQKAVFENYLQKDYDFFNNTYLGTLGTQATRLRDAYNDYCTLVMNGVMKQSIAVVTSIAIIAWQSVLLAAVTLLSMGLLLSFTVASSRWRFKYRRLLSEASAETAGVIGDALGHGSTVKSFAAEEYENQRLDGSVRRMADTLFWSWMSSIPPDIGRMLFAAFTTFVLLLLTGRLYEQHRISIALVVLVQLYVIRLVMATQDIADLLKTYESIMSAAHQAVKTMLIRPAVADPAKPRRLPHGSKLSISFEDVTYRYGDAAGAPPALQNLQLHIAKGEKIGLVGYSGSGKTTLTKLLMRFLDVSEGSIMLGGVDIRQLAQKDLRSVIAYVPQEPLLFHRSIAENIAYGRPDASAKAVREAGTMAYIDEFVQSLPKGYDTLVGEHGVKLSGGQRQRVAIARALLRRAPILVLDEATSSLDSESEAYIQQALATLMHDCTALVIAHRLSTIQHMDRIIVLDKGKVVQMGTHTELLRDRRGTYARLWAHQSGGYFGVADASA